MKLGIRWKGEWLGLDPLSIPETAENCCTFANLGGLSITGKLSVFCFTVSPSALASGRNRLLQSRNSRVGLLLEQVMAPQLATVGDGAPGALSRTSVIILNPWGA